VHLLEFTRTSENYFQKSIDKKHAQYKEIIETLTRRGWKVKLHIFQMGCRGFMPISTKTALLGLGNKVRMQPAQFACLYSKLSAHAIRKAYTMVRTRNLLLNDHKSKHPNTRGQAIVEAARLHHKPAAKAIRDAKKKLRDLESKQRPQKGPPKGKM
jgi:hypothetical protein